MLDWWATSGLAEAKSAEEAEYERLKSEMTKSARLNLGRCQQTICRNGETGLEIGVNELLMQGKHPRVGRHLPSKRESEPAFIERKEKHQKWYTQLNNNYGQVTLIARNSLER